MRYNYKYLILLDVEGYTFVKTYDLGDKVKYHLDRETFYKEYMIRSNLYKELRGVDNKIGFKNKLKLRKKGFLCSNIM